MKKLYQTPDVQAIPVAHEDVLTASETKTEEKSTPTATAAQSASSAQAGTAERGYSIYLKGFDPSRKLVLIQAVMQQCGVNLAIAKTLVEGCTTTPKCLCSNLTQEQMQAASAAFSAAGATLQIAQDGDPIEPSATPAPAAQTCHSKIFINGGRPYGTDCMGILIIDDPDRYVLINYSEAPIEVDVTPGRHFVAIGAGEHLKENTPSLRREFTFEKDTVLTVDIAAVSDRADLWDRFSGDPDAVIRFQVIRYDEYEKALRRSSFKVTRKKI